ncbi:MAG: transglutaminase domain-containing protein [Candidatus Omnitrophica bacterium]|nr:transglutaminase domain-containing protein [Candidatus Omnitrophota bacterium]
MRKKTIGLCLILLLVAAAVLALNAKSSTRQGINGIVSEHPIPVWIKAVDFLSRHYHYKELAWQITKDCATQEERVLAIFKWTHENIRHDFPRGWPIYDDHVLNIIIRGFGTVDQTADVFTTLSTYAGVPAAMYQAFYDDTRKRTIMAAADLNGRFVIFDPYYGNYFRNAKGELASIDDILAEHTIVEKAQNKPMIRGVAYEEYFKNLVPIDGFITLRAELQMPMTRLKYEIKRKLGLTKKAILFYGARTFE